MKNDHPYELMLNILLSEFQSIRSEILETLKMQYTILSLGTAFLTGLFGIALSQISNPLGVLLLLLVPFVSVAVSALWGVEGIRRVRAASYVRNKIAPKVNLVYQKIDNPKLLSDGRLLAYEFWFREENSPELKKWNNQFYRLTQVGVIGTFLGAGLMSWLLAAYYTFIPKTYVFDPTAIIVAEIVLIIEFFAMVYVGHIVYRVIECGRNLINCE